MSILDNKYRFLSLLSKNEVTSVFLGEYIPTGQYIIIKIAIPGQEKIAATRFEKEYNILKRLDHPNIVKALDFSNSYPYLVFEYIQGENALQKYKDNSVPLDESYAVLLQLHDSIKYLHQNSIIHRDIKPSNIIIEKNTKRAVLVDFETARNVKDEDGIKINSGDFSPPELILGTSGYFTDIYSIAKIALFMLSNKMLTQKQILYEKLGPLLMEDYKKRSFNIGDILSIMPQRPLLYFFQEGIVNRLYPIIYDELRIGRDINCEVRILDENFYVDEVHAVIKKENGKYIIHDNNSVNGIWLFDKGNFIRVSNHSLRNNDVLALGWNSKNGPYMPFRIFV